MVLLVPVSAAAQLIPGKHTVEPMVGVSFATKDLLSSTTLMAFGFPPFSEADHTTRRPDGTAGDVNTTISLDPGVFTGLRYSYNVNRRLAVEGEFDAGVAVFVIQMLEIFQPGEEGADAAQPQYETTTTDARIYQYLLNMSYHFATWGVANPFFTLGVGSRTMDLRQSGSINPDAINDRIYMAGLGTNLNVNERLRIRFAVRSFLYNFSFDNQYAGRNSDRLVSFRDVGRATAVAAPTFQNDVNVNLGFVISMF